MYTYTDPDIITGLQGGHNYVLHQFVEIQVETPIYLTSYMVDVEPADISIANEAGTPVTWVSGLLSGVSTPAKSGNITQEVQTLSIGQGIGSQYGGASTDFLRLMGDGFHGARIIFSAYLQPVDGSVVTSEPLVRNSGIVKGLQRNVLQDEINLTFSNSFGKLDGLNELRTTPGSLKRRNKDDTSFDRAFKGLKRVTLNWGT